MSEPPARPSSDWRRGFIIQLVVTGLAAMAVAAIRPTTTYRALSLGASPFQIGLIQSAYSFIPAFIAIAIGRRIDRAGEARFIFTGLVFLAAGSTIAIFAPSLLALGVAQITLGLGQIVYLVASQSLIVNSGRRTGREVRLAHNSTAASVGQLAGPAIAAALVGGATGAVGIGALRLLGSPDESRVGVRPGASGLLPDYPEVGVFIFAALICLVACGLAILIPRRRRTHLGQVDSGNAPGGVFGKAGNVLRRSGMPAAMFVSITVVSAIEILLAYMPAYGVHAGLSVTLVGTLLSVRAGASLVSRFLMSLLIRRLGRSRLLASSMLMAGVGMLLMPFMTSPIALITVMAIVGLGLGLGQPMTIGWVAGSSQRDERATALGLRLTGNRAALFIAPTVMGAIAGTAGLTAIFVLVAISLGIGAVVALTTSFEAKAR